MRPRLRSYASSDNKHRGLRSTYLCMLCFQCCYCVRSIWMYGPRMQRLHDGSTIVLFSSHLPYSIDRQGCCLFAHQTHRIHQNSNQNRESPCRVRLRRAEKTGLEVTCHLEIIGRTITHLPIHPWKRAPQVLGSLTPLRSILTQFPLIKDPRGQPFRYATPRAHARWKHTDPARAKCQMDPTGAGDGSGCRCMVHGAWCVVHGMESWTKMEPRSTGSSPVSAPA